MLFDLFSIDRFPFLNFDFLKSRITWSIRLRWIAVIGFIVAVFIAENVFNLQISTIKVALLLGFLAFLNSIYYIAFKIWGEVSFKSELLILSVHIFLDLIVLTYLIHLTGGIDNPIYIFYIFHIVLSSFIFPRWIPYVVATFTSIMFSLLIYLEYTGIWPHYCLFGTDVHANKLVILLVMIVFVLTAYMTTYICTTFMKIYRQMKSEVDIRNRQLVKLDEEKAAFFRFTSHELKSPIIAIKSSIDSLIRVNRDKMDEKSIDLLGRTSARASQMLDIINELLELSNSKKIGKDENIHQTDLKKLIEECISEESPNADAKNIRIETHFDGADFYLDCNPEDLKKVFLNLINNAVRYSGEKTTIEIIAESAVSGIHIQIKDRGIGIPEGDIHKVFNEFYRSANAKKAVSFGTGLGLSLVKNIIEKYNGEIRIESVLGKGTTFHIRFKQ